MFQVFKVIRVKVCFEKSIPSRDISSNRHYFIKIYRLPNRYLYFGAHVQPNNHREQQQIVLADVAQMRAGIFF